MSAISAVWLYVGWGAVHFETNYGLMQHSPFEIKEKLLKALDKEYNVVDMAAVIEIVSILERTPITKEALETTRLGRYINELRRKTTNELLARRAKDLVRRWRDMILPPTEAAPPPQQNGAGAGSGAALAPGRPRTLSPSSSNTSPVLVVPPPTEAVPKTHASNKRLRKEAALLSPGDTPPPKKVAKVNGASFRPETESGECSRDGLSDRGSDGCEIVSIVQVATPSQDTDLKSTKKKGRQKGSKSRSGLDRSRSNSKKLGEDILKEKIASIARTPRVKTTQELVADLRSRSGETTVEDGIAATAESTLPGNDEMSRNKNEHMAKFLRSQSELEADDDSCIIVVDLDEKPDPKELRPEPGRRPPKRSKQVNQQKPAAPAEPAARSASSVPAPPSDNTPERTLEEILSRLPPLDPDSIVWDDSPSPPSTPPPPREITSDDVTWLHTEHIDNINGNFDHAPNTSDGDNFREWHETVSRTSYNGELLHILPYVVID